MLFLGPIAEMIDQMRSGKRLELEAHNLREWLVADPLSMVSKSKRARARLRLRMAEYLAMLGREAGRVSAEDIRRQEQLIMEARTQAEEEARTALEKEREQLKNETATRLEVAQLAVDLLTLGRTWSEHFNEWSASQETVLNDHREQVQSEVEQLRHEMSEMRRVFQEQIHRLSAYFAPCRPPISVYVDQ